LRGEFLKHGENNTGARGVGRSAVPKENRTPPTLAEAGIPKKQSMHAQTLATVKETKPELYEQARAGKVTVSKVHVELKRDEKREERQRNASAAAELMKADGDQCVKRGDFREVAAGLDAESVDLIFTDPPYHREYLPLYGDLAEQAARVLKPGGSLICYLGQYQLPEVMRLMTPHLRFWWPLCCLHTGASAQMREYGIKVKWKPMLWFVKGTRGDKQTWVDDLVESRQEKDAHEWQQGVTEAAYYIDKLTIAGEIVFDPFCGGGTTAVAAKLAGRRWLTCDVDDASVSLARKRVRDA
jgi:16S rRNA G966 N2-methylase RsmD